MSITAETPMLKANRETIYSKLMFLSSVIGSMDGRRMEFSDDAEFAMCMLLSDIAKEIYPEWKEPRQG